MLEKPVSPLRGEQVRDALLQFVNADLGLSRGRAITAEETLEAAGVDSLAFLKVLVFIETEYGFWVPDEDLTDENISSVAALARYICSRVQPG